MSNRNAFIVLEGVDGSGKTTVGKELSKRLGARFYQTPSGFFRNCRDVVENWHPMLRFFLYLSASIHSSFEISRILKENPVVCDRYIYSTWTYHMVYGCKFLEHISLHWLPIRHPDTVYYLCVSKREREERISSRRNNTKKDMDSDLLEKVDKVFKKLKILVQINTTNRNKEEVVNTIFKHICGSEKNILALNP